MGKTRREHSPFGVRAVMSAAPTSHLRVLTLALAFDGLSSLVEGWAVWRRRPWAPWLIVVATGSLVPIEVALILGNGGGHAHD
jgi:uncharacterized membrane protein (DUF2068 family)